jgi:hypothetical protein
MTSKIMAMDRPLNRAWHQCKIVRRAGVEREGRREWREWGETERIRRA